MTSPYTTVSAISPRVASAKVVCVCAVDADDLHPARFSSSANPACFGRVRSPSAEAQRGPVCRKSAPFSSTAQ